MEERYATEGKFVSVLQGELSRQCNYASEFRGKSIIDTVASIWHSQEPPWELGEGFKLQPLQVFRVCRLSKLKLSSHPEHSCGPLDTHASCQGQRHTGATVQEDGKGTEDIWVGQQQYLLQRGPLPAKSA